jgi:hypothetical protein
VLHAVNNQHNLRFFAVIISYIYRIKGFDMEKYIYEHKNWTDFKTPFDQKKRAYTLKGISAF